MSWICSAALVEGFWEFCLFEVTSGRRCVCRERFLNSPPEYERFIHMLNFWASRFPDFTVVIDSGLGMDGQWLHGYISQYRFCHVVMENAPGKFYRNMVPAEAVGRSFVQGIELNSKF